MSKERQLRKQEESKNAILNAAREIVSKEGIEGLSIRKITNAIDYSPAIIYHYFKNKEEIIASLASEGYSKILNAIGTMKKNEDEPEKEMRDIFTKYIEAALEYPEEYKAFMLSSEPSVVRKTGILERGIAKKTQTMQALYNNIQRGINIGRFEPNDPELTAQIIWTSTFGLIIKIMMEKDISQEQINRLIYHHFTVLFKGLMKRGS